MPFSHLVRSNGTISVATQGPLKASEGTTLVTSQKYHDPGKYLYNFKLKRFDEMPAAASILRAQAQKAETEQRQEAARAEAAAFEAIVDRVQDFAVAEALRLLYAKAKEKV